MYNKNKFIPLFDHQNVSINFHMPRIYSADFSEQGTGKTRVGIEVLRRRLKQGIINKALIACPASVTDVWAEEFEKFSNISYTLLTDSNKKHLLKQKTSVFIISYDSIASILPFLEEAQFDMLIGDESSRVKNPLALRTKALIHLSQHIPYRMLLSATPIPRDLMDVWSQFMILDQGQTFTNNFYKFRAINFSPYKLPKFIVWNPKPTLLPLVKAAIKEVSIRHLKQDCLDLPPKLYQKYYITLTKEQQDIYDQIAAQLPIEEFNFQLPANKLVEYAKLGQITSGFLYGKKDPLHLKNNKEALVMEIVDDVIETGKIILYYVFDEEQKIYSSLLKKFSPLILNGQTPSNQKAIIRKMFQTDNIHNVLLIQEHSGIGITLTKANTIIYLNNNYSYEDRYHSEDRAHRAGQLQTVNIIDIITKDTLDERVLNIIATKRSLAVKVLDE